jgi:hypothetical protein
VAAIKTIAKAYILPGGKTATHISGFESNYKEISIIGLKTEQNVYEKKNGQVEQ